ncbi:hypothetical protein [Promicromonospora sp. NPDC060271]|uniref:hypothetical protein n=1 Tax=Promicromonospora sp. NPDC060271 TaxID=3347089 RepID=UPI00365977EF
MDEARDDRELTGDVPGWPVPAWPAEVREHSAMYRADADRIAALISQPERPDRETSI